MRNAPKVTNSDHEAPTRTATGAAVNLKGAGRLWHNAAPLSNRRTPATRGKKVAEILEKRLKEARPHGIMIVAKQSHNQNESGVLPLMSSIADKKEKVKSQNRENQSLATSKKFDPEKRWKRYKIKSLEMSERLCRIPSLKTRGIRMSQCGQLLSMMKCPICGRKHISSAHMCHDRLCPLCQWQLSRIRYSQMLEALNMLDIYLTDNDVSVGMLTLTLKNCRLSRLRSTLKNMSDAWNNMSRRKFWKDNVLGTARHVEITYNAWRKDYHPHLHILLILKSSDTADVIQTARAAWKHALGISYEPIIDYRRAYVSEKELRKYTEDAILSVKPVISWTENKALAARSAAREAAKYIVGSKALINIPDSDLEKFAAAIAGLRFVSYSGILKEARKALGYADEQITKEDQVSHLACSKCGAELEHYILEWAGNGYVAHAVPPEPEGGCDTR